MSALLRRMVRDRPEDVAIIDEFGSVSWAELDGRVDRWAAMLRAHGLKVGDHVCFVTGNRRETFEALLACLHTGLTVTPVNWHLTPHEIAHIVADSGSRCVLTEPRFAETAATGAAQAGGVDVRLTFGDQQIGDFIAVEPLLSGAAAGISDECSGAVLLYTSGTSGLPRGVVSDRLVAGAPLERVEVLLAMLGERLGLPDQGRVLVAGPWYHSAQTFFSLYPLLRGCALVLMPRFDAAEALRLIDEQAITLSHLVPTHFVRLLRLDDATREAFRGTSLTRIWHGGGPCPPEVKRRMIEWWGEVFAEYYAATEGGIATFVDSATWSTRPGTVGKPLPPTEIVIVDADGEPVGPGVVGKVYVRTPGQSFHYHNAPEKTRAAQLTPDTATYGDLGYLDGDGYLFIVGRTLDTIIAGGVNIYAAEVEAAILTHPGVRDAAVFGIPDEEFGERVAAVVELQPGTGLTADDVPAELDRVCRERLAGFKTPRSYAVVPKLPRDPSGKLRKAALRDEYTRRALARPASMTAARQ
ncbi:AMP-binding protein [Nocardia brasiliensis]|uniref:AMP-binding protein n=1 Tax=Nocardia brasiliensis TaxID=37326 RepID=UPI00366D8FD4